MNSALQKLTIIINTGTIMYRSTIATIGLTLLLVGCSESPEPQNTDVADAAKTETATEAVQMTDAEKRAYALGANPASMLARSFPEFEQWGIAVDKNLVKQGFTDMLEDKSKLSPEELQTILLAFQQELQQKVTEIEAEQKQKADVANATYLKAHAEMDGVIITESGLQYRMLVEGTGAAPVAGDVVRVNYKGTLIDGTEFDSSYSRGEPIEFQVDRVIPGWAEGIKLVKEGGKIELVMAPELAYGANATPDIPAYSVLAFEVELLKVNPEPEVETPAEEVTEGTGDGGS